MPTKPYILNEERVPSVTTILANLGWNSGALIYWGWDCGKNGLDYKDLRKKAAGAGSYTHVLIELDNIMDKDRLAELSKELNELKKTLTPEQIEQGINGFNNFVRWKEGQQYKVVATEPTLISEKYRFGGTPDMIARKGDSYVLYDWKTSKGGKIYADTIIQVAAYKAMWEELNPDKPISEINVVKVDRENGNFVHGSYTDVSAGWEVFKHLIEIHKFKKQLGG